MTLKQLFLFPLMFVTLTQAQTTKNVYFIGNSYTEYNNLPELVQKIALSTNDQLNYQKHTPGGSRFQQHAANPNVLNRIAEGTWDYVVLQEQSQLPSFPEQQVVNMVYPYAQQLVNAIKHANPCGAAVFYMTWGRKFGDQQNCDSGLTNLCTYEGMDDALYNSYMRMAADNRSLVSPVSKVWRKIRELNPNIELYDADNSHPSYIGSMAAAYTFYTVLFKKDPTLTSFIGDLSQTDAAIIKGIVKNIVFDHPETWFVGIHDNPSDFKFEIIQNQTYQFEPLNPTATTFLWNFGDGTTSDVSNPTHTYLANGNYTVSLTTNACNSNTVQNQTIAITSLSGSDFTLKNVQMYPNPATDFVTLTTINFDSVMVFDVLGKAIHAKHSQTNDGIQIDLKPLKPGMYFVQIQKQTEKQTFKVVKK